MAQNLRKYHVHICTKKKIFYTKKVTAEKHKLDHFWKIHSSNCVRSAVVFDCEINFSPTTSTVCDLMQQYMNGW